MAELKATSLHISITLSGTRKDNEDSEAVGFNESKNLVLDFGNENQIEKDVTDNPWLLEVTTPIIKQLKADYENRLVNEAKPKEKTAALKAKLKGLI